MRIKIQNNASIAPNLFLLFSLFFVSGIFDFKKPQGGNSDNTFIGFEFNISCITWLKIDTLDLNYKNIPVYFHYKYM